VRNGGKIPNEIWKKVAIAKELKSFFNLRETSKLFLHKVN